MLIEPRCTGFRQLTGMSAGKSKGKQSEASAAEGGLEGCAIEHEAGAEDRSTGGEGIRALVNALHAEQPQAEQQAASANKKRKGDAQCQAAKTCTTHAYEGMYEAARFAKYASHLRSIS